MQSPGNRQEKKTSERKNLVSSLEPCNIHGLVLFVIFIVNTALASLTDTLNNTNKLRICDANSTVNRTHLDGNIAGSPLPLSVGWCYVQASLLFDCVG
jgi:hypothetical protein